MKRRRRDGTDDATEREGGNAKQHQKKKNVLKGDNPLARARGSTQKKSSGSDKLNSKALSLWHKKSGAGYQLFIQYYAQQSDLFQQSSSTDGANIEVEENNGHRNMNVNPGGGGQSRAAKRRKRKRAKESRQQDQEQQQQDADPSGNSGDGSTSEASTPSSALQTSQQQQQQPELFFSADGTRLMQALQELSNLSSAMKLPNDMLAFLQAMATPLPLTFRIRQSLNAKAQFQQLEQAIQQDFGNWVESVGSSCDAEQNHGIFRARKRLSSNPTTNTSNVLSKTNLAKLAPELKSWLVENSTNGSVARQELGSMLPVLLLSLGESGDKNRKNSSWMKAGSRVLDLCASPGSKTLQALEVVGANGRIRANDINASRLDSLREAIQRSNVPNSNRIKYSQTDASQYTIPSEKMFDAIICDVPCSGDGTIRKDPQILPNWTPKTSNALHSLQVKILVRAIQCLKAGGVVCYSTCSLNPVENEAVVAEALNRVSSLKRPAIKAELLPLPNLEGILLRPGVLDWKVADYSYENLDGAENGVGDEENENEISRLYWYESFEAATAEDDERPSMEHATPSLWPPTKGEGLHLERCGRLWPQDNECGGFFVALIQRS